MQKIHIKNFFAIQEAEFMLDQVLLLIGEQASGKSTVAKLIYFFRTLGQEIILIDLEEIIEEQKTIKLDQFQQIFLKRIRTKFVSFFGSTKYLSGFDSTYYYSDHKWLRVYHRAPEGLEIEFEPDFYHSLFQGKLSALLQTVQQQLSESSTLDGSILTRYYTSINKFAIESGLLEDRQLLFVPSERSVVVSYPDSFKRRFFEEITQRLRTFEDGVSIHSPINLYLLREFVQYSERLKDKFKNSDFNSLINNQKNGACTHNQALLKLVSDKISIILKGQYKQDRYGERVYYSDNKFSELEDLSSGQQESIRIIQDLFLTILEHKAIFRIIEEPEVHLYPMAQKHLIELLAIMLNNTNSQVIITTHSPYILSVFNNLLYANHVARINPTAQSEIIQRIPEASWLKPETFYAYALKAGKCQSIIDRETGLIDQNFLDEISEELGDEFNTLYSLHTEAVR